MEYLIVELFDREGRPLSRRVKVDDELLGRTDEHYFELERGTHFVSLGPPSNFTPEEREVRLRNTTVLSPRAIRFDVL
ncbi:MAG: hypothetical protein JRJ58_02055 [Deltaproteobacteria bacterium]|nr:hypothetical protein [Deltaproteobacteria bacterium]